MKTQYGRSLPVISHPLSDSLSDSKERRFNLRTLQIMLLWIVAKAKVHKILAFYTFMVTLCVRYGTVYVYELTIPETTLVPEDSTNPNIYSWTMPDSMKVALEKELVTLEWKRKDSASSTKEFIEEAKDIVSSHVSGMESLETALEELVGETSSLYAVILHNLPMDPYIPATPTDGTVTLNKPTFVAEAVLLAIGELAGTRTIGYQSEKHYSNPWVHEGFPRTGEVSALTAPDQVPFHQDMSYQNKIPDLLGLICLREGTDHNVQTTLLDTEEIARQLSHDIVSTLRQNRFRIAAPRQWVDDKHIDLPVSRPVLQGRSLHLPVDWENMIGVDTIAQDALTSLKQFLREVEPVAVHLVDGMMVLFNNQKVVHARTPYKQVKFDGSDRVVYRSYFATDLSALEQDTRII